MKQFLPICLLTGLVAAGCAPVGERSEPAAVVPDTIRVAVSAWYPVNGANIDQSATGDWGESLSFTRQKVDSLTLALARELTEGSRYHGDSRSDAVPSLVYEIIRTEEYLEPLPTAERPDGRVPMTDYRSIVERMGVEDLVTREDVDEIWVWGYHGGVLDLWESNMAGPWGDVSNSDRDPDDLPVFDRTYTVYHYNYQRGLAETIENHLHQFEALVNHLDGRDSAPEDAWSELLFWGHFVGSDISHKLLEPRRAGWSHYPPNAEADYEWARTDTVLSDIDDWTPAGTGTFSPITCAAWECSHLGWFRYWMRRIPGRDNGLYHEGEALRDWWTVVSRWDEAKQENWTLVQ